MLELAASYNVPVFLSIGFQACHLSKAMEYESFSDGALARLVNSSFVPIRVDRDERRDIDLLYTMYYEATTGKSGWPLNVFLDPNSLAPFFGGNYWPSTATNGTPSFEAVLSSVASAWRDSQDKCVESAQVVKNRLTELYDLQNGAEKTKLSPEVFKTAWEYFRDGYDTQFGGFSKAPKFLLPHNLSFLLKYSDVVTQGPEQDTRPEFLKTHSLTARQMASETLRKMGEGAVKDQVGQGFHHYSVTDDWSFPKFEKLLIDQALMLSAYVHAYQCDPVENKFAVEYITDLVEYMSGDVQEEGLKTKQGGLVLAVDGDSEPGAASIVREQEEGTQYNKVEGAYYFWQYEEVGKALGKGDCDMAEAFYGVKEMGNTNEELEAVSRLAYQNTLFRTMSFAKLGEYFGVPEAQAKARIRKSNAVLKKFRRATRPEPGRDERVFAGYNGAAVAALAQTAVAFGAGGAAPRDAGLAAVGERALATAKEIVGFVREHLYDASTGTLQRYAIVDGARVERSAVAGMNDDYAYMVQGLIALYSATFETEYLDFAKRLQDAQFVHFWDREHGAFYYSDTESAERSKLFLRFKNSFDAAEPSSNGVSCANLFALAGLLHDPFYADKGVEIVECYGKDIEAQPYGYCSMLGSVAASLRTRGGKGVLTTVVAVGGEGEEERIFRARQQLVNSGAEGALSTVFGAEEVEHEQPSVVMVRLTRRDVEEYYEPYGHVLYGALMDKYGGDGGIKYVVIRNGEVLDAVETLDEVLDLVG